MTVTAAVGFVVLVLLLVKISRVGRREHYLPPGPSTLPLLGNLHMFPTEFPHYKSVIYSLPCPGQHNLLIFGVYQIYRMGQTIWSYLLRVYHESRIGLLLTAM
jgi:hypothetical protein